MPLMNYTTRIEATRSIGEIQEVLQRAGARRMAVEWDADRRPCALTFGMPAAVRGPQRAGPPALDDYRLPVNVPAVHRTLEGQYERGDWPDRRGPPQRDQAERVAWRLLKDWLEAQWAVVSAGLVTADEVLFPYLIDAQTGQTVYEGYVAFKALPAGASGRA